MTRKNDAENQRRLNIDLGRLALPLLFGIIFLSPYPRALFFPSDLYPFIVACSGLMALLLLDDLISWRLPLWSQDAVAALLIAVAYAVSFTVAVDKHMAIQDLLKYLSYFVLFYAGRRLVKSPNTLKYFMRVVLLSALGVCAVGLLGALGIGRFPGVFYGGSILSTFQYRNALGGYLLGAAGVSLTLSSTARGTFEALVCAVGSYVFTLTIIATYSRGTWVLFPCLVLALVVFLPREARWKALYSSIMSLTCSFLVIRRFWEAVGRADPVAGLRWLAIGTVAALVLETVWIVGKHVLRSQGGIEPRYRRAAIAVAVMYTLLMGVLYTSYMADTYPNLLARVFPSQVITRAGDIKADESSLIARLTFIRDALRISTRSPIIGSGGGGFNALYHMYQDALYWSSEVHSHYFQVLVEAGIVGLGALVAMWVFVIRRMLNARDPEEDPFLWGASVGAFISVALMSIHAAIDFDLSLPAMAFLVWAMLGATSGSFSWWLDDRVRYRNKARWERLAHALLPAVLVAAVVVLAVVPYRFYRAGHEGAQGARWLLQNNYAQAGRSYAKAISLNPYNATFYIDMAQCQIGSYYILEEDRLLVAADEYIQKALAVQPYNLIVRFHTVELYLAMGRLSDAVAQAEELVRILPYDPKSHELVAMSSSMAALHKLATGKTEEARTYMDKALQVRPEINRLAESIPPNAYGIKPQATANTILFTGQALLMNAQLDEAVRVLTEARRRSVTADEASLWLGLTHLAAGREREGLNVLQSLIDKDSEFEAAAFELAEILGITIPEVPR